VLALADREREAEVTRALAGVAAGVLTVHASGGGRF